MDAIDRFGWASPSDRWRSFEAEAFRVTGYRYDSRTPSTIAREGFLGNKVGNRSPFALFGEQTVFAAASTSGADRFLNRDYNLFNRGGEGIIGQWKLYPAGHPLKVAGLVDLAAPHFYRFRTDTHASLSFKDLHSRYEWNFALYSLDGARGNEARYRDRSATEMVRHYRKNPTKVFMWHENLRYAYAQNDELHVRGPVLPRISTALAVDQAKCVARANIQYAGMGWLDLAVEL